MTLDYYVNDSENQKPAKITLENLDDKKVDDLIKKLLTDTKPGYKLGPFILRNENGLVRVLNPQDVHYSDYLHNEVIRAILNEGKKESSKQIVSKKNKSKLRR